MDFTALANLPSGQLVFVVFAWAVFTLISSNVKLIKGNSNNMDSVLALAGTQTEKLNQSKDDIIALQKENSQLLARVHILEQQVESLAFTAGKTDRLKQELDEVRTQLIDMRRDLENERIEKQRLQEVNSQLKTKIDELQSQIDTLKIKEQN